MGEDLDERVLHRLVSVGSVPKVLVRDARRPPLMERDELAEPIASLVHVAGLDEPADGDGQLCVLGEWGRESGTSAYSGRRNATGGVDRSNVDRPQVTTHEGITMRIGRRLQFNV